MDLATSQWFATLGVGGVLAGMMFVFYRRDVRRYTDEWRGQSEMLIEVVKENTAAITALTGQLQHGFITHPVGDEWVRKAG